MVKKTQSPKKKPGKLDQRRVFYAVLELLVLHRPATINYSLVSRRSKVPRSTLYYYFGTDISKLLDEAVRFGMKTFTRVFEFEKGKTYQSWENLQYRRLFKVYRLVKRYPWIPALYFRYRGTQEPWGEIIREIEEDYGRALSREWKRFHGRAPSWDVILISSYFKLGLLWGLSSDQSYWNRKSDPEIRALLRSCAAWVAQPMK